VQSTSSFSPTGNVYIDGILMGTKWALPETLTFSFPADPTSYGTGYGSGETANGFKAFTVMQQNAERAVLQMYSSVANITFTEITETSTQHADLRYAESNVPTTAWGYFPTTSAMGGDVWLNNSSNRYNLPSKGNYAFDTLIHETGHALGLKHPQDSLGAFGAVPLDHDSLEYSVMSYRSFIGGGTAGYTNATDSYAQSLMMYDIAALQTMYGANYAANNGDTIYKWDAATGQEFINGIGQGAPVGNKIFMTTWDGGGNDTYDFSNYITDLIANLQPGEWTTLSSAQLAKLGGAHVAAGNIANSLLYDNNTASLIENAVGGAGNDTLIGNDANNRLTGGSGSDALNGGLGVDTAVYSGQATDYQVTQNADGSWTVVDLRDGHPDGVDTLSYIEQIQFSDKVVSLTDIAAPSALRIPIINAISTDTGTAGDGITSDNVLTLKGVAAAGTTVDVYEDVAKVGTVVADKNGQWTLVTSNLADGSHSFTAVGSDAGGHSTSASPAFNVIVDTIAPDRPIIASFSPDTGKLSDAKTNTSAITLQGTAEAGSIVHIFDGATLLGTSVADASGGWSYATAGSESITPAYICMCAACAAARAEEAANQNDALPQDGGVGTKLADGLHVFNAFAEDAAGNMGAQSLSFLVTVDTVAPNAPTIAAMTPDTGVAGDRVTASKTIKFSGTAEAGSKVQVYDGATLLGSATANANGSWALNTSTLKDGVHSLTATATDTVGNISISSKPFSVTLDTAAPNAPSISSFGADTGAAGDQITSAKALNLAGMAEAGSTVRVYDGGTLLGSTTADGSGAWSYITAALADGSHSLTAVATDLAGNASALSAALSVSIDSAAPNAPSIAGYSPDSGIQGDGITSAQVLRLTGTAEAGSSVKVYDGATLLGSTTTDASGAWSYTTGTLSNGAHSLTATATDTAGNVGIASSALKVTVATGAGAIPVIQSLLPDTGVVGDGITKAAVLSLVGTADAGSTLKIYDGPTLLGSTTADSSGAWSFTTGKLPDGVHSLTAVATDAFGNTGTASAALNVTVDSTAPGGPSIAAFGPDTGVQGDSITSAHVLHLSGTAEAGSTVKLYDGATLLGSATTNDSGTWNFTTGSLADGIHGLTATATDVAGNTGLLSTAFKVTVDSIGPGAPSIAAFRPDSGIKGDGITNAQVLKLNGSAEAGSTVDVYDGGTLLGTVTANGSGVWSLTTGSLADGAHSLTAVATDPAGNASAASAALNVTVDSTAPGAPDIASFGADTGLIGDGVTSAQVLDLTGTAEADSTVQVYDGATLLGTAIANSSGAWSFTTAALGDGLHALTATSADAAGNISAVSTALNITVDSTAPDAPTFGDDTPGDGAGNTMTLPGSADSHGPVTSANVLTFGGRAEIGSIVNVYDGTTLLGTAAANASGTWSFTTGALADGAHSLTASATDAAGNVGAASAALDITIDTAAPVAPDIASFGPDSGVSSNGITNQRLLNLTGTAEAGSMVKLYDGATLLGTAVADGSGAWSFVTSPLGDGAHSLTATATDAAGNTGATSSALSVAIDSTAPEVPAIAGFGPDTGATGDGITSAQVLSLTGTAEAGSTVKLYDGATLLGSVTASGNGAWSFTTVPLADGDHHLTATAFDVAGNASASSAVLNVTVDSSGPAAPVVALSGPSARGTAGEDIVSAQVLALVGTAEAGSTVQVYDGGTLLGSATADGYGAWSLTTDLLNDGTHSLVATATDAAGNTSDGSAVLHVNVDHTAPEAPSILAFNPDTGLQGDGITSAQVLNLTGAAEAGSVVQLYDGAILLGSVTANLSGAWTFTTSPLGDGVHSLTAVAIDAAGNSGSASAALNVTVESASAGASALAVTALDGSKTVFVCGITGQKWTSSEKLYAANGNPVSEVWKNGDTTLKTQTWNADGSTHDIHYYGITGQAFTDYLVIYGANDKPASASYSNGMTKTWSYNADGTLYELASSGITGQKWTSTSTLYGANGKPASQVWNNGETIVKTQTWNADGSIHDTHFYGITGQSYTEYEVLYENSKQASASYSNGMTKVWSYNSDGTLHEVIIDGIIGQKWTSTDTLYGDNGKPVSETWHNGADVVKTQTWNADGSVHATHYYGISGQAYTDYEVVYGANGKQENASYSNGMTQAWSYNDDGTLHEVIVNGITGQKWTSTDTLYGDNGKAASEIWSNGDTVVKTQTWNADGTTHTIHYYGITDQPYTDYEVLYGANGKQASAVYSNGMTQTWTYNDDGSFSMVSEHVQGQNYTSLTNVYDPNFGSNRLAAQETVGTNGTEILRGYENGLTIAKGADGADVRLPGLDDAFHFAFNATTTMSSGAASVNFVFDSGFGKVTITDFAAQSQQSANYDTIAFAHGLFQDFADLQSHMSQDSKGNTVISHGQGDMLVLSHIMIVNLHANDFILL
jgi:hypothetical protein